MFTQGRRLMDTRVSLYIRQLSTFYVNLNRFGTVFNTMVLFRCSVFCVQKKTEQAKKHGFMTQETSLSGPESVGSKRLSKHEVLCHHRELHHMESIESKGRTDMKFYVITWSL